MCFWLAGCPFSHVAFSSARWSSVYRGRAATQSLSGLQEHGPTWYSSQEQLSGKTRHDSHPAFKETEEPKTTLSVFSDFLQGSTSAPDLQLSLDDGYAVLNSDNYTLRSDKRYSDGSWHYMSAVRSSTGWDTMTSFCLQPRSSSQLKCSKITQLACVDLIFSGWSSASIIWKSLRHNRPAAGHSGRNWKEAISLAASLTFTQGGLETLEICSHIDDIRRLFLIITWIYVFLKI